MADLLLYLYPWTKSLHIISVIAWMAGLFYLPRLYVYHAEQSRPGDSRDEIFQVMELKLFRLIMNPSMIATWVFGLVLVSTPGVVDWAYAWPWAKAGGVLAMTWFHHWLGRRRKEFIAGQSVTSGRTFRIMNEVPTLLLILIVFSVIFKF